jgi:hypothetical protein
MLKRISKLRKAWRRGYYHSEALSAIADQSYWEGQSGYPPQTTKSSD